MKAVIFSIINSSTLANSTLEVNHCPAHKNMGIQWESQPSFPGARWDWPRLDIPNCTLMPLSARLMIHDVIFLKKPGISASSRYFNIKKDEPWVYSSPYSWCFHQLDGKIRHFWWLNLNYWCLTYHFWLNPDPWAKPISFHFALVEKTAMGSTCAHSRCCGLCDGDAAVDAPTDVGRPNQVRQWTWSGLPKYFSGRIWHVLFSLGASESSDHFDTWALQVSETFIVAIILINTCFGHRNSDVIARLDSVPCFLPKKAIVCSTSFFWYS